MAIAPPLGRHMKRAVERALLPNCGGWRTTSVRLLTRAVQCWGADLVFRDLVITAIVIFCALSMPAAAATYSLTIAGLGGAPDYDTQFPQLATELEKALLANNANAHAETLKGAAATRKQIEEAFTRLATQVKEDDFFAVTLIGHGTFDGVDYKFNVPGPDPTASDLARWMDRIPARQQLIAVLTSSSGAALPVLAKKGRIVITATKSGTEKNVVVFSRYWVDALRDPSADADKNGAVSALEAFRYASRKTAAYYEEQKELATEHSQLSDNGSTQGERNPEAANGQGLAASAFPLIRSAEPATDAITEEKRTLLAKKDEIQARIDRLKYQKAGMDEQDYRKQLAAALLELAKTQAEIDK
jgi:hypothetical protein